MPTMRPSSAGFAEGTAETDSCSSGSNVAPSLRIRVTAAGLSRALSRDLPCRVDRALEIVHDLEQTDQHFAPAALGVFRKLLAHSGACVLEFFRGLAVLREVFFRLFLALRELLLE